MSFREELFMLLYNQELKITRYFRYCFDFFLGFNGPCITVIEISRNMEFWYKVDLDM